MRTRSNLSSERSEILAFVFPIELGHVRRCDRARFSIETCEITRPLSMRTSSRIAAVCNKKLYGMSANYKKAAETQKIQKKEVGDVLRVERKLGRFMTKGLERQATGPCSRSFYF